MVCLHGARSRMGATSRALWRYLVPVIMVLALWGIAHGAEVSNYTSSWLGNTWPGTPYFTPSWGTKPMGKHVNYHMMDICVSPNGKIISTSYWEESARYAPIHNASTGENIGQLTRDDGMNAFDCGSVAANGSHAWASSVYADQPGYVSRYDLSTSLYTGQARLSNDKVWGLAINGTELYVSDTVGNTVKVVNPDTLALIRSWSVTSPGKLAIDASGNVWVLQRGTNAKAICYTNTGTWLREIIFPADVDPQDIAVNPTNGRILIADAGIHSQIRIYAVNTGTVSFESTFGADYGIFSGVKGEVGPLKFNRPNCVDVDSAGNIYIASNGGVGGYECGAEFESYTAAGTRRWNVYGLEFTDIAAGDPGSDPDLYTKYHHYIMDYSKDTGKEWTYKGFTYDKFAFPQDPRNMGYGLGYTRVARIAGKKFLALDQSDLCIYRFDAANWGEVAIPSAMFIPTTVNRTAPPGIVTTPAIWRDADGDGRFDANEYQYLNVTDPAGGVWQMLPNGDVIFGGSYGHGDHTLYTWKCQGLDAYGNPIYPTVPTAVPLPATLPHVHRLEYDTATDTMYLGGYNDMYPGDAEGFRVISAYANWSHGNRTPLWTLPLPFIRNGDYAFDIPRNFTIAGDYVFYVTCGEAQGSVPLGSVYIYRKSDGSYVGHMQPGMYMGITGLMDFNFPLTAYKKADGEYIVCIESAYYDNTLFYRWSDQNAGKVVRPTISPAPSAFTTPRTVSISCGTAGAIVRYTTDGTDPTAGSPLYTVPLLLTGTTTLKTRAFKSGMSASLITTGVYTQVSSLGIFTNDDDVGGAIPTGFGSEASGTYTLNSGSGTEFQGRFDCCHYLYRTLTGDGSITARVASLSPTALSALAGVMIRESTAGGSKYAGAFVNVYSGLMTANRLTTDAPATGSPWVAGPLAPYWLRLTRTGNVFNAYYSPDGVTWAPFSSTMTVTMPSTVLIGICAGSANAGTLGTSMFTNVTVTGPATVTAPTFGPAAGTYYGAQTVTIGSSTAGASIRYTTDGTTPTSSTGTLYTAPVSITATKTLKAIAYKAGWTNSPMTSGAFTVASTCAAPTFDAPAGTFDTMQAVTMITQTPGATIRYTTNGTTPSATVGTIYTGMVTIDVSKTLNAIAYKTGLTSSSVTSGMYTIKCVAPSFSPVAGIGTSAPTVVISTTTAGATIRYTKDGATPSATVGTIYTLPVAISQSTTLKAIAYKTSLANSDVTTGVYTIKCVAPNFSLAPGNYSGTQSVKITTTTAGATIRYTTDGTMPSSIVGTIYTAPVDISQTKVLKAIAYKGKLADSDITSGIYTIILANSVNDFSSTQGQKNWYYGYYDKPKSATFIQGSWNTQYSCWSGVELAGPPTIPVIGIIAGHLEWGADNYHPGPTDWPVRRWVANNSGNITITGVLAKLDTGGGDGIIGHILVNGVEKWAQAIAYHDAVGVKYSLNLAVTAGDHVEFAVEPGPNYFYDATKFTAVITSQL